MPRALPLYLLLLLAFSLVACADTLDDFSLTGNSHTITFSFPSNPFFLNFPSRVLLLASAT